VWRVFHAVVLSTLMRSKVAQQLQRRDKGPATDSLLSLVSGKWLTCGQNALPVAMGDAMVRNVVFDDTRCLCEFANVVHAWRCMPLTPHETLCAAKERATLP